MKNNMKISAALLLCALTVSGCALSGCAKEPSAEVQTAAQTTEATSAAETEETTTGRVDAGLGERDFDGQNFTCFARIYDGSWNAVDLVAPEQNGEPVNDAVYIRNTYLEDKYNFTLTAIESNDSSMATKMRSQIMAGDAAFDMALSNAYDAATISQENLLYDLNTVGNLDLSQPWWSQTLLNGMSIGGKLYFATGEISIIDNYAVRVFFFNKDLRESLNLENPYDIVNAGNWTVDKLFTMAEAAVSDINGDSVIDKTDRSGISAQTTLGMVLATGSGATITTKDSSDMPYINVSDQHCVEVFDYMKNLMSQSNIIYLSEEAPEMLVRFGDGLSLFHTEVLLHIQTMRSYEIDIGILPLPKYNEEQDNYIQFVDGWCINVYTIPVTNTSPDDTGFILEVMCADSMNNLTPAFYDVTLNGKYVRDEESSAMLDIIFDTYTVENANIYSWGSLYSSLQSAISGGKDIASTIASNESATQKALDKTLAAYGF